MRIIGKSEPLFAHASSHQHRNAEEDLVMSEKSKLTEQVFGLIYLIFIVGITLCVLMELKMEYQIDIFPGINTPFDDVYRDAKNVMGSDGQPQSPM